MNQNIPEQEMEKYNKQGYRFVGHHSSVKVCGWTKSMLRGTGSCYKHKFYGIQSYRCVQMTTSMSCANRCTFCWRDFKAPVSKVWKGPVDDPKMIVDGAIQAQIGLLQGFKGNKEANQRMVDQSFAPKHVALSLTGEPIFYPKINELCEEFHKRNISTFLVTNAQYPDAIRDLKMVTQLYVSLDACDKESLKEIDKPLFGDFWERLMASLDHLSKKSYRTVIRLTAIKGKNMDNAKGFAELIRKGNPDFVEIKGYMWVGASRDRLKAENMPTMKEIKEWTKELLKEMPEYEFVSEQRSSYVTLIAKKEYKDTSWINYPYFFECVNNGKDPGKYEMKTPQSFLGEEDDQVVCQDEGNAELREWEGPAEKIRERIELKVID